MDALYESQRLLVLSQSYYDEAERKDGNTYYISKGDAALRDAGAYAAIAQAEQLKRIADMLEGYLVVHADPAVLAGKETK